MINFTPTDLMSHKVVFVFYKHFNTVDLVIFARFQFLGGQICEFKNHTNFFIIIALLKKNKNLWLREKSQNQKFTIIWASENYQIYSMYM